MGENTQNCLILWSFSRLFHVFLQLWNLNAEVVKDYVRQLFTKYAVYITLAIWAYVVCSSL